MNNKSVVILCFLFVTSFVNGQYYYNDVLATKQINQQILLYKQNNVKEISVKKLNKDNEITEDFSINKTIETNFTEIKTTSVIYGSMQLSKSEYANLMLTQSTEEKRNVFQKVSFLYNKQNLSVVTTITYDSTVNEEMIEEHKYTYNSNGIVVQMLKIKNDVDTMLVNFKADNNGNIIEENWLQNGRNIENYYYYYNDKNQLTDVVRFNKKLGKLLPSMLLEYNDNNQLYKLIEIPYGSSYYMVWAYFYATNGLKDKELLYNKSMELQGKLIYMYK